MNINQKFLSQSHEIKLIHNVQQTAEDTLLAVTAQADSLVHTRQMFLLCCAYRTGLSLANSTRLQAVMPVTSIPEGQDLSNTGLHPIFNKIPI